MVITFWPSGLRHLVHIAFSTSESPTSKKCNLKPRFELKTTSELDHWSVAVFSRLAFQQNTRASRRVQNVGNSAATRLCYCTLLPQNPSSLELWSSYVHIGNHRSHISTRAGVLAPECCCGQRAVNLSWSLIAQLASAMQVVALGCYHSARFNHRNILL